MRAFLLFCLLCGGLSALHAHPVRGAQPPADFPALFREVEAHRGPFLLTSLPPDWLLLDRANGVRMFNDEERQSRQVFFRDGLLCGLSPPHPPLSGTFMFVMDENGNFFLDTHKVHERHHSSFFRGERIASGGMVTLRDGRITYLNNKSGHYTPNPFFLTQALVGLEKRGVPLDGVNLEFYDFGENREMKSTQLFRPRPDSPERTLSSRPSPGGISRPQCGPAFQEFYY